MKYLRNQISRIIATIVLCAIVVVGSTSQSFAYSVNFSADNAKGYVVVDGERYYVEKKALSNGQIRVSVTDSKSMITEAQISKDIIKIYEKQVVNGKKKIKSTKIFKIDNIKYSEEDTNRNIYTYGTSIVASKSTAYGYSYSVYKDNTWSCYNNLSKRKEVKYNTSTKSKLESYRTSVNAARNYELKILASGTSALLGIALTVATAGVAAIIAAIVGGGGTLTLANIVIDYGTALGDCKYYYGRL